MKEIHSEIEVHDDLEDSLSEACFEVLKEPCPTKCPSKNTQGLVSPAKSDVIKVQEIMQRQPIEIGKDTVTEIVTASTPESLPIQVAAGLATLINVDQGTTGRCMNCTGCNRQPCKECSACKR